MTVAAHSETLEFQTEVRQLLNLMIHSLYSNKEIFLRELISNSADAGDKLRFEALTDDALYEGGGELCIRIEVDKPQRTVSITDNGIGMSRTEVMENIGTIAKSGTRQFFESLTGDQSNDTRLIGQFGVGFYSAFIVADKVTLLTRRAGLGAEHGVRWESDGAGRYTLETVERAERGTQVILHLRKDEDEFLEPLRLRSIVRKYSDHISLPIQMQVDDDAKEWETVNRASALWARPRREIGDEEYKAFYKHVGHDFEDPLTWTHNQVEGKQAYTALLYVPKRAPFDLWDRNQRHGIKLYVRRVFIMDDAEQLMPMYLRFVRGVVDSDDLPLNISREILQHNRVIEGIRGGCVKKVLDLLESMAKDQPETYAEFWKEFGRVLKEGPAEDYGNRERIAKLLRFASTKGEGDVQTVTLEQYISRMRSGQESIYYITADSPAAARHSPHLEVFRKKDIEVLLLSDRVDEWLVSHLREFSGKALVSVAKGDLDLDAFADQAEKTAQAQAESECKDLVTRIRETLGDKVREVRVSHRLIDSPACLVLAEDAMSVHLQRVLAQAGHELPKTQPILEINPAHTLVRRLNDVSDAALFTDWCHVLFDQALLNEGGQLEDPAAFVRRLNGLLEVSGSPAA